MWNVLVNHALHMQEGGSNPAGCESHGKQGLLLFGGYPSFDLYGSSYMTVSRGAKDLAQNYALVCLDRRFNIPHIRKSRILRIAPGGEESGKIWTNILHPLQFRESFFEESTPGGEEPVQEFGGKIFTVCIWSCSRHLLCNTEHNSGVAAPNQEREPKESLGLDNRNFNKLPSSKMPIPQLR